MSDTIPNYYPWSADGELCPVLQMPDVWMKVFYTDARKHLVKRLCKDFAYRGVIRKNEVETFGCASVWLMNKPDGREALSEILKKKELPPLHFQIFDAFHQQNLELKNAMPLKDFCAGELKDGSYLDLVLFQGWLAQRRYSANQSRSIALVACAFAILQPKDASAIVESLCNQDPVFRDFLLPLGIETASVGINDEGESKIATNTDANENDETSKEETDELDNEPGERPAAKNISVEKGESSKLKVADVDVSEVFTIPELRRGGMLLKAFLQAQGRMMEVINFLPAQVNNLRLKVQHAVQSLNDEFNNSQKEMIKSAEEGEEWLTALSSGLEAEESGYLAKLEPLLDTIRNHAGQSRETLDLLRNACEEVGKLIIELISKTEGREKQLSSDLAEIRSVNKMLGQPEFRPVTSVICGDILCGLRLWSEINAPLTKAREDRGTFILGKKQELQEQFETVSEHYDASLLGPDLAGRFHELRGTIQNIDGNESLNAARTAYEKLMESLRANPAVRSLTDLASEALFVSPTATSVVIVARALNARKRTSEALALLTCLQATTEVETSGLADFSGLVDELMQASGAVANANTLSFAWIDGVFQQPWIQELRHSDIRNPLTWQRLAVAFVVQEHVRGTEQETDLFYNMEFQKSWPKDSYPILRGLLNDIGKRSPVRILTDAPPSQRRNIEGKLTELFRKNDRGEYLKQAGRGDKFYDMERLHLFPAMERIRDTVRTLCDAREWDAARTAANMDPDKMLRKACNDARIDANTSAFYRRAVLAPQTGYVPEFLQELKAFIDAAINDAPSDTNFVLFGDVIAELAALESQQAGFAYFWTAVRNTLSQAPFSAVHTVNSGDQLLVALFNTFGPVTTFSTNFVTTLCNEGSGYKPGRDTLEQMLQTIAEPQPDLGLMRLQTNKCYRHALRVLSQVHPQVRHTLTLDDSVIFEARTKEQLEQTESDFNTRRRALADHPQAEILDADYENAFAAGYFGYVEKMLHSAEERVARASEERRGELGRWLHIQLDRLTRLKNTPPGEETPEDWIEKVFDHCSQLEKILVMARTNVAKGRPLDVSQITAENAIEALAFVVENNAQSFDEVESHIVQLTRRDSTKENTPLLDIAIPEIATLWKLLKAMSEPTRERARPVWEDFIGHFASATRLYHERKKTLISSGIIGYSWSKYSTRFYDPRGGWLDREVRLYLCFGEKTPEPELEILAVELAKSSDSVNIIFVPNGMARLTRLWKYDPFHSPYVLIGEELICQICAVKDRDGNGRHDVPLRQAIHQAAENLTAVGLFKSDGYVHQHKNLFVGRDQALLQLTQQPASVIWGGRRTGKTSLLHALAERLTRPNITGGAFDAVALVYGDDDDMAIAREIASDLNLETPETLEHFKKIMRDACKQKRIAVLIDETDGYIRHSRDIHGPTEFPLARILRGLSQSDSGHRFKLVYAGFKHLFYQVRMTSCSDPSDPFKNIAVPVTKDFRNLKPEEVHKLMKMSFEEMLGGTWDAPVPRLIFEKTSGHPAFVQCFCERLLERLSGRRKAGTPIRIAVEDVEAVYSENSAFGTTGKAFIDYVNETLNWNVSHLGRAILMALCSEIERTRATYRNVFSSFQIKQLLKQLCVNPAHEPSEADVDTTMQFLTMTNMLTSETSGVGLSYRITYPAYIDFMKRLDRLQRQEFFSSLEAYHNDDRGQVK